MYAQYKTPIEIINLPIGSSLNNIKNKMDKIDINKIKVKLVHQGDNSLKYSYGTNLVASECTFSFVEDSLCDYSIWIKTGRNLANKILSFLNDKYGKPDTLNKVIKYKWSNVELENGYKTKINILYYYDKGDIITINFNKFNLRLLEKAKKKNKKIFLRW